MIASDDPIVRQMPQLSPDRLRAVIAQAAGLLAHHESASHAAYVLSRVGDQLLEQDSEFSMRSILNDVARRYSLTIQDLRSGGRSRRLTIPRQEAMYLMRQVRTASGAPRYSLPQIGQFLNMDHTTVLHGVRAHEARMAQEAA